MNKKTENGMGQLIRVVILSWSAALLTASYAGMFAKMDPTFIATVFTASAATFGINTMKKSGGDDEDEKKELPKTETVVEPTPEPIWEAPVSSGLEQRVGALEAKVEGDEGEGFVQPRTGA
jgi:ABC-type cobalt transport system substrate-binding protein